jgi:hypothetical protein
VQKKIQTLTLTNFTRLAAMLSRTSLLDKVKRVQELRRSNAATPVRNKKKYSRKVKHKNAVNDHG